MQVTAQVLHGNRGGAGIKGESALRSIPSTAWQPALPAAAAVGAFGLSMEDGRGILPRREKKGGPSRTRRQNNDYRKEPYQVSVRR
jgi:hypothetical protein